MVPRVFITCVLLLILACLPAMASAQKLVLLVRHAERADGGAGVPSSSMTGAPADPLLSAAGQARAEKLALMLADSGIKAIYATEFKRTQDTGKPLSAKLGVTVRTVAAADSSAVANRLKAEHTQDVVLVIGHSNTLPASSRRSAVPR